MINRGNSRLYLYTITDRYSIRWKFWRIHLYCFLTLFYLILSNNRICINYNELNTSRKNDFCKIKRWKISKKSSRTSMILITLDNHLLVISISSWFWLFISIEVFSGRSKLKSSWNKLWANIILGRCSKESFHSY